MDIVQRTLSAWKKWPGSQEEPGRPDPLHDEYQLLSISAESSSGGKEHDEVGGPSTSDDLCLLAKEHRPSVVFDTPTSFIKSLYARFLSLWTPSFTYALLGGQLLSLSVTCWSVTTSELVKRNWTMSSTQLVFGYSSIFIVYTPYTIYRYGFRGWTKVIMRDGWKYFLLAFGDAQGHFIAVKAYGYTDLLSCMLLDAWAIPVCLLTSWIYMRTKYHWTQVLGVAISIGGLCLLIISDLVTGKTEQAENRGIGDALMIVAATIFGIANATEEFFVRQSPLYEVMGQFGMWATLVTSIQAFVLERDQIAHAPWNAGTMGLLVVFTLCMFTFFSLAPLLFRTASSSYLNMSLLTSDFYGLIVGLFLFVHTSCSVLHPAYARVNFFGNRQHYSPYWLYFPAFAVVISGLVIYFWHATPEEQGGFDVHIPSYVLNEGDVEK